MPFLLQSELRRKKSAIEKLLVDVKKLYSFNNLRIGTLVDQAFSEKSEYYKALK